MDTRINGPNGRINHFRANVEIILAQRDLRMIDLAREMGVAAPTLRDMVHRGRPREATLRRFAKVLKIDVEDLVRTVTPELYGAATIPRIE